nr:class I SAM-dependent methyltransferase [Candidatus Gracilibacteria bacterium]
MKLIKDASGQKLRGGFYTPERIAHFMLKWALNGRENADILEPSCGDGVFLEQLGNNSFNYNSITGIELDIIEARKSKDLNIKNSEVINSDFHTFCNSTNKRFDIVIGNPPYIRYQYFDKKQQDEAEKIFKKVNIKYSKLTNAWVSFVIGSCLLLKEQGKIGFVLPAELLQVSYAKPLRNFLAHFFHKINIISFKKLVFPDIQQEVVLLLCEKNGIDKHLIEHIEVTDIDELEKIDLNLLKTPKKEIDFEENKWTFYFLEQDEVDLIEKIKHSNLVPKIKKYADVEVGITTGANDYFSVSNEIVKDFSLNEFAKPLIGRSIQANSLIFTEEDWYKNNKSNIKSNLLVFKEKKEIKNKKVLDYIKLGEEKGINKGYKCKIRDEWQIIPSIKLSNALFTRRNNLFPKLIENLAEAYTTDTMHRVFIKENVNKRSFIASFYNSLSFAFSEIVGRSYGGGVLELMPSEVGDILLPYNESNSELLDTLDIMIREKRNIEEILDYSDNIILKKGYGFTDKEIKTFRRIWKRLSGRRLGRKN